MLKAIKKRKFFAVVFLFSTLVATTGCRKRVNHLYQHLDRLQEIYVSVEAPAAPRIYLGSSTQKGNLGAAMSNISSMVVAQDLGQKLRRAAPSDEMVGVFTEAFLYDVHRFMKFREVKSARAPCDAELNIAIKDYGIRSYSAESAIFYTLSAEVNIFDCDTGEIIWNDWVDYNEQITPYTFMGTDFGKSIGTSMNLIALSRLSKKQMHDVFKYLLQDASREIANQMKRDTRPPRQKRSKRNSKRRRR